MTLFNQVNLQTVLDVASPRVLNEEQLGGPPDGKDQAPHAAPERLSDHPLYDPKSERPIPTYVLVHKPPSWLFPVKPDKRLRNDPEYIEYFGRISEDVRERGVMQPIIAVRKGEAAETLDGETRRRAALLAGCETVPILVYDCPLSPCDLILAQLQSNEMRLGFNDLERAQIYAKLMELNGWTQVELARFIHVSQGQVSRVMSVSQKLPVELRALIGEGEGKIPPASAYHLSRLPTPEAMTDMADKIMKGLLSRDAAAAAVTQLLGKAKGAKKEKPVKVVMNGMTVIFAQHDLQKLFGLLSLLDAALKKTEKHGLPLTALPSLMRG